MSEPGEIARFQAAVELFNKEGGEAWRKFGAPDMVLTSAPGFPAGGRFEGIEAVVAFARDFEGAWESVRYDVQDPRLENGAVVHGARWVVTGKESGAPVTLDFFGVIRFDGDLVSSVDLYWTEEEAIEHARAGAPE